VWTLATVGEFDEAMSLADDMLTRAEATGVPWSIAYAYSAYGKAFTEADPARALDAHRAAVRVARESGNRMFEMAFSRELAPIEAAEGEILTALDSFDQIIDAFHKFGDLGNLAPTLGYLVVLLDRIGRHVEAATLHGAASRHPSAFGVVTELAPTAAPARSTRSAEMAATVWPRAGAALAVQGEGHGILVGGRSCGRVRTDELRRVALGNGVPRGLIELVRAAVLPRRVRDRVVTTRFAFA
jgi:tetratricopeptide (TPR) repeat protein